MKTTVTIRGQTAVPAKIRKRFHIQPGQRLEWVEDGGVIYVLPVSKDPIAAFGGSAGRQGLVRALLKSRAEERGRERAHR